MQELLPDKEHLLLNKIAEGNEQAFTEIFHHYRNKIYSYSLKMLQSEEVAKEVTQEVFMKLWITRAKLIEVSCLDAFLFTIARNHCFNLLKRSALERKVGARLAKASILDNHTEQTIYFNEYRRLLEKAIAGLPPRQKEVYLLSYVEGLKREEVARQMDISQETVKSQLALAVKYIRTHLGAEHTVIVLVLLSRYH
jgi:RNA polymerase sigma-70 factor (ECF subfamily)